MQPVYRNRQELENLVVTYHQRGWSIHKLKRVFGLSRNTVRAILRKHQKQREQGHSAVAPPPARTPRATKLDTYIPQMKQLLDDFPDIVGQRMFEELRAKGYSGGITQVRDRLKTLRPKPKRKPTVRFETDPGKQGQFDWSPYRIKLVSGGTLDVLCFSYVLAFSRRQYIDFTLRRDFYTLIRRHVAAFETFGGVPETCLYDGEKTVILRWEARQPIFNPAFLAFITHYGCRPIGCGPRRPELKGKVEHPFKYVDSSLLNARTFHDLNDLRAKARWWMPNRSDTHKHDTTGRPPIELFVEQEQAALLPLPRLPFDTAEVGFRVCDQAGFVEWKTNLYSVAYQHIGDILTVKAAEQTVVIYGPDLRPIAEHPRAQDGSRHKSELPEHRQDKRVRYGIEPVRTAFEQLGDQAAPFLSGIAQRHPRNGGFHARRILVLRDQYHSDNIHKALVHAMRYQAFDALAIERILRARFVPRTLEQRVASRASETLKKTLPPITQRPLSAYQRFLTSASPTPPGDDVAPQPEKGDAQDDPSDTH